jgi:hypothetical protein
MLFLSLSFSLTVKREREKGREKKKEKGRERKKEKGRARKRERERNFLKE